MKLESGTQMSVSIENEKVTELLKNYFGKVDDIQDDIGYLKEQAKKYSSDYAKKYIEQIAELESSLSSEKSQTAKMVKELEQEEIKQLENKSIPTPEDIQLLQLLDDKKLLTPAQITGLVEQNRGNYFFLERLRDYRAKHGIRANVVIPTLDDELKSIRAGYNLARQGLEKQGYAYNLLRKYILE